ncbi:MAG: sulfur carrier protein ThiS [Bacteroidales bacterium]|nr:sulfur carrier protein ThiS [Bacteroidales bacterium]
MITVNNKEILFEKSICLTELLSKLEIKSEKGVAVAIHNNIIPKHQWNEYFIKDNDKITVIRATQGG